MSRQLINEYRGELDRLRTISGSQRESVLREAFKDLLKKWGRSKDLLFVPEHEYLPPAGNRCYVDGALLQSLRLPFGYWEAKDENDDLDKEIAAKFRKGYPQDNIIFEDTATAVLIQNKREVARVAMDDTEAMFGLLTSFFAYEQEAIADFRKAVKQFAQDLPQVLKALREEIATKRTADRDFASAEDAFLKHARDAINPAVTAEDVQEMLIQHILTEDIFAKVFENPDFHRQNNVAAALYALEEKLFGYGEKQKLLKALGPYYAGIQATAAVIESHSEKQGFLKGLYENFYKVYNPLAADRLGVVYTPGEIVRFMIRSADWLCEKHFGKNLVDKGVEILDPATGTGTFIVELLEHFRGHRDKLAWKYKEELHANEVAILPYYVANLNIEATYAAITGQFAEYPNLCFVDTLDNVAALGIYSGHQGDMFGSVSDENLGRIKRQNERKISVIIGNPPYNANQHNENDNNKNRAYERVDQRIKQTYIKASKAQKTKLYDMYARFYRWASDRLDKKDGIVAFITNRSFIESRTFDGFRKMVAQDFNEIWVIDLGGDVRANPRLSGTKHNVFGIQTGVAIAFLVRRKAADGCTIRYIRRSEDETAEDKLSWLGSASLHHESHDVLTPDEKSNWITDSRAGDWATFIPMIDQKAKVEGTAENTIFRMFSNGFVTARDEWMIDHDKANLAKKTRFFSDFYAREITRWHKSVERASARTSVDRITALRNFVDRTLKWTSELESSLDKKSDGSISEPQVRSAQIRPYVRKNILFHPIFTHRPYKLNSLFVSGQLNKTIAFLGVASNNELAVLSCDRIFDYGYLKTGNGGTQGVSRYRYTKSGERVDNITDWAVAQFADRYEKEVAEARFNERVGNGGIAQTITHADGTTERISFEPAEVRWPNEDGVPTITKDAIFAYCYAVLHDPLYREKYALNLKREFPRIPFYDGFAQWVAWGEALLKLHIEYEQQKPFKLTRIDTPNQKRAKGTHPKPKLKSDPAAGAVTVDEDTQLTGIPTEAWTYRLGNRSAIDWVLDQHKEKTPRDPTIAAKFNTYRFADYKEAMIELLAKVLTVSLETVKVTEAMRTLDRSARA